MGRIIFLSQLFDPEPTIKGQEFVDALNQRGVEVEVITGFPNYPGGKIYPGYRKRWVEKARVNQIDIVRLATYMSHNLSAFKRMLCYLSFYFTSLAYILFKPTRTQLIYAYYPTLTVGLAAVTVKLLRRIPVILDIQDMWPDSIGASGMMSNRCLIGFAHFLCGVLYRNCNHIIVQSPGFKDLLASRGVPPEKITVILNWTNETSTPAIANLPSTLQKADGVQFLFAGNMGFAQGLGAILDAAKLMQMSGSNATFSLMGDGTERSVLEQQADNLCLKNVRFLPRVPMSEASSYLAAADVLIVHLKDQPLFRITIPSKTQAYLFAGKPILMAAPGDASDLVVRAGAGLVAIPEHPQDLAQKAMQFVSMTVFERAQMGANGRSFYASELSMHRALDATATLIKEHWRQDANVK